MLDVQSPMSSSGRPDRWSPLRRAPSNRLELSRRLSGVGGRGAPWGNAWRNPPTPSRLTGVTRHITRQSKRPKTCDRKLRRKGGRWITPDAPSSTQPAKLHEIRKKECYNGFTICAMLCLTVGNFDGLGGCDVLYSPGGIV